MKLFEFHNISLVKMDLTKTWKRLIFIGVYIFTDFSHIHVDGIFSFFGVHAFLQLTNQQATREASCDTLPHKFFFIFKIQVL